MDMRCTEVILAGLLLCSLGQNAFGAVSSFVPVNERAFRMRQPDGKVRMFVRDAEEPNLLYGEEDWTAELDGRRVLAMKDAGSPGQQGYLFIDGYLQRTLRNGKERKVALPPPGRDGRAIAALWPAKENRLVAAEPPDIWKGGARLRLWFGNPNKAGLLFAEISVIALAFLFLRPLWIRILGGVVSLAAFVGLVQTSSRGAFLALLCGLAAMGLTRIRSLFSWRRIIIVGTVALVVVGCLFVSGQFDRMAKNLFNEGQRETSRLIIWKEVPRMMADAPGGWGYGRSARAYIDWYQPKSECLLKDLISGHLTFLVESGWVVRFLYLVAWFVVGLIALLQAVKKASPVPLAVMMVFAVAACFNPVVSVPELWVVPAVAFMAIVWGLRAHPLSRKLLGIILLVAMSIAGVMCGAVYAWAISHAGEVAVYKDGAAVLLNGRHPTVWIADDDYALHGGYWWLEGRELRNFFAQNPDSLALGYVRAVTDLPPMTEKIVLIGEAGRDFLALSKRPVAKKLVFLSPPFSWQEVPETLRQECEVRIVAGEHAVRLASGGEKPPAWVTVVPSAELYLPEWFRYLL